MSLPAQPQPSAKFVEAPRAMTSVLASAERRCLIWLAGRLPDWVTPDHLTGLALTAMLAAGLSYWAAQFDRYWLVGVVASLALNWFGDSLDGTLARVRRQERPRYGFYIDHVVDCAGVLFLLTGLGSSGFMSPFIAMALLIVYFMLSIEIYLATYCLAIFRMSFWGFGPTELRVLLAIGTLALFRDPTVDVFGQSIPLFDFGGGIAIALIGATCVVSVVRNARALRQAERPPSQTTEHHEQGARPHRRDSQRWLIFNIVGMMGMAWQLLSAWMLITVAGVHYLIAIALSVEIVNSRIFAPAVGAAGLIVVGAVNVDAATLAPETAAGFDRYAATVEQRLDDARDDRRPFLWVDGLPAAQQLGVRTRLRNHDVVTVRLHPGDQAFPGAMCHHWVGTVLVSGARIDEVVRVMQQYDDYERIYWPAVRRSRVIARTGNRFNISLQFFMKKGIDVALNTESSVLYIPIGHSRMQVRSRSTKIAEVANPGAGDEREKPVGRDHGFLWRFNNYCGLDQRDEGTIVQCETVSLTRDTPFGLGWLIDPFVSSIPRESLEFTLQSLRAAVATPRG